jgi:hypothetical protein
LVRTDSSTLAGIRKEPPHQLAGAGPQQRLAYLDSNNVLFERAAVLFAPDPTSQFELGVVGKTWPACRHADYFFFKSMLMELFDSQN